MNVDLGLQRRAAEREAAGSSPAVLAVLQALGVTPLRSLPASAAAGAPASAGAAEAESELLALLAAELLSQSPFEPVDSAALHRLLSADERYEKAGGSHAALCGELRQLSDNGAVELEEFTQRGEKRLMVLALDPPRLRSRALGEAAVEELPPVEAAAKPAARASRRRGSRDHLGDVDELDSLLQAPSIKERRAREEGAELAELLLKPTAREQAAAVRFRSQGGPALREYCPKLTREECRRASGRAPCSRVHFVQLLQPHTELALGDCSFLDTCRHMRSCKYVHYALDPADAAAEKQRTRPASAVPRALSVPEHLAAHSEAQWLCCDVRSFELPLLGTFGCIMADPPWDIHMDLPYGTMGDDEMRNMAIGGLQSDGVLFLWVTGRATELGRECLALWGYSCVQELVWVKTNQLQRIIRTGRTGHWLNHSKEHCLVGVKGRPALNRHIDCDVLVAEVRETSRKPDEIYALLERLSPGTRKLEIFGREHNTRPGWVTLGNQLPGDRILEPQLLERVRARYPERPLPAPQQ
jgi:mRNA (2'-O-methyladenosine-N6-)-methyltransferase